MRKKKLGLGVAEGLADLHAKLAVSQRQLDGATSSGGGGKKAKSLQGQVDRVSSAVDGLTIISDQASLHRSLFIVLLIIVTSKVCGVCMPAGWTVVGTSSRPIFDEACRVVVTNRTDTTCVTLSGRFSLQPIRSRG